MLINHTHTHKAHTHKAHTHTRTNTHKHTHTHTHTHTQTHTHTRTHTHTTHTHTHTKRTHIKRTHTCTNTHTHIHTHTCCILWQEQKVWDRGLVQIWPCCLLTQGLNTSAPHASRHQRPPTQTPAGRQTAVAEMVFICCLLMQSQEYFCTTCFKGSKTSNTHTQAHRHTPAHDFRASNS